jgi:hypothetical protein
MFEVDETFKPKSVEDGLFFRRFTAVVADISG